MNRLFAFASRPHAAALAFLVAGSFWFVVGTIYGSFSAIHLVAPEFFNNIPFLVFSRARPAHVNTVLFGFVTTTLVGAGLYYTPVLLARSLWSERLAWISFLLWNTVILSGPITFGMGMSQGREYAEYLWFFDCLFVGAVVLILLNMIMTVLTRKEDYLYISVWYFVAAFIWTAISYFIGNVMWHPRTGAMSGIIDSIFLWFWGHNLPGLVLTPLAVGAGYYVIPRIVKQPLNSHMLSIIGFWTLVIFYSHIGGHHILQAPIPTWLKTVSVVDSLAMFIPVAVVLFNWWITSRGFAGKLLGDPAGRFVIAGSVWYLLTCIQGPVQSLPQLQRVTHFNNWTVGHSHIAILGFAGFIALGILWHILPSICGRKIYSRHLITLQFGLIAIGLAGFLIVLSIAGLIQGGAWDNGEMVIRILPELKPYMIARLSLGIFIIAGAFLNFFNLLMTIFRGVPSPAEGELS
jgi:cbb3-type cytochrome c oxidase subunit I